MLDAVSDRECCSPQSPKSFPPALCDCLLAELDSNCDSSSEVPSVNMNCKATSAGIDSKLFVASLCKRAQSPLSSRLTSNLHTERSEKCCRPPALHLRVDTSDIPEPTPGGSTRTPSETHEHSVTRGDADHLPSESSRTPNCIQSSSAKNGYSKYIDV